MYRSFLANGNIIEPHVIDKVLNRHGAVIGESPKSRDENLLEADSMVYDENVRRSCEGRNSESWCI